MFVFENAAFVFCIITIAAGAARADVVHGRDGKSTGGKLLKETALTIEWTGEDGKKKEFPKAKVARLDLTFSDKAPAPPVPGDAKELKNLQYADATLGIQFEPQKDFLIHNDSFKRKLVMKSSAKGIIQFTELFTIEEFDAVVKRTLVEEGSTMPSVEWKDEGAIATPFPGSRHVATWKPTKTETAKREYQFLQLPGRILVFTVEAPAGGFAAAKKSADALLATLQEFEPEPEQKFDKAGFVLSEPPRIKLQYKGSSKHKMRQGSLEGTLYNWVSETADFAVIVYEKDIPDSESALKELLNSEYTKFSNITVKSEGTLKLGAIDAPWVEAEADLKEKGFENYNVCMFLDGGKLYSIHYIRTGKNNETAARVFQNCVAVVRTPGMRAAAKAPEGDGGKEPGKEPGK